MKKQTNTTSSTKSKAAANKASAQKDTRQSKNQFNDKRQQAGNIAQLQVMANGSAGRTVQRVNDNAGLESEADVMGGKALQKFDFVDNRPESIEERKH